MLFVVQGGARKNDDGSCVVNFQAAPDRNIRSRRSLQSPVTLGISVGAELATSASGSPFHGLSGKSKTLPHLSVPYGFGSFKIQQIEVIPVLKSSCREDVCGHGGAIRSCTIYHRENSFQ